MFIDVKTKHQIILDPCYSETEFSLTSTDYPNLWLNKREGKKMIEYCFQVGVENWSFMITV